MSTSDRSTPSSPGRGEGPPAAGSMVVEGVVLAAAAAFLVVLGLSIWLGVCLGLGQSPGLRVVVEGEVSGPVRLLSGLLEGPSGVWLLGGASAGLLAWGVGAAGPRPTGEVLVGRLRRLGRDLDALSRDAARWVADLPRREGVWHAAALALLVLGGLALRMLYLSGPVRYDEAFTFTQFAALPLEPGLSRYTYPNNHLLHTLLVHLTTSAVGSAPAMMRLPAFLAGAGTVPAAYAAWDALGDADEALVAASVAAVTTPLVLYSTNARGYAIVVLLSLLMVPLAARLLRRRDLAAWGLLCIVAAAALHAVPVALYPAGAVLAWLVLSGRGRDRSGGDAGGAAGPPRPRRELLGEASVAVLVVGIAVAWLYSPAVQRSGLPAIVSNRWVTPSPVGEFAAGLPGFVADVWTSWTAGWPTPAALVLGALALVGVGREAGLLRAPRPATEAGGRGAAGGSGARSTGMSGETTPGTAAASYPLVALAWSVLLLLAGRRVPFARVWLFLAPVFGLLAARGIGWAVARIRVRRGWAREDLGGTSRSTGAGLAGPAAAVLLLAGLGGSVVATNAVVESPATDPYRDGEEAARLLQDRVGDADGVVAFGPAEVVLEYWFAHLGMSPGLVDRAPEPGGRLYVVVHEAEGQTLPDLMARLGVSGSRRIRIEEVAELDRSTVYALLPPEQRPPRSPPGEGAVRPGRAPAGGSWR